MPDLPPPKPRQLYAVMRQNRRGWSILSHTISRTRSDARRAYCRDYVAEYQAEIAEWFKDGRLRVVPVTVTAQMEAGQ